MEDDGNITITDGLKKVFKSNFKFDIAKKNKEQKSEFKIEKLMYD